MWVGNRCFPPKDVQLALESLFGCPVSQIKVIQYSIFVRFHWRAIATTRTNRIYLRGSGKEFFSDGPLVLHEYFDFTSTEIFRYRALLAQHRTSTLPPGVHPIRKKSA